MEYKHYLNIFSSQSDYESQKNEVMDMPHVVLLEDTNEVIFASKNNKDEIDYALEFFTIEALEEGTVGIGIPSSATSLKYRKNNELWIETSEAIQLSVVANDTIQISCVSDSFNSNTCSSPFAISTPFNVKGNIMSLLYGDNFKGQIVLRGKHNTFSFCFYNCTTLQNAENLILPATTLADYCYDCMFSYCTSLTTSPELPATTLADFCYYHMFDGCSKLNYIKMLATDISASNCLSYWVNGVASSGTFVKHPQMTSLPSGASSSHGIPYGWTVENEGN